MPKALINCTEKRNAWTAGHITTDMQAGCQMGDYVSLTAPNDGAASELAQAQFSWPKRRVSLGVRGGWRAEGDAAYLLLQLCHLFRWCSTPATLSHGWAHWRRQLTNILLGKSRVDSPGTVFLPENSNVVFLTPLKKGQDNAWVLPNLLTLGLFLGKREKGEHEAN